MGASSGRLIAKVTGIADMGKRVCVTGGRNFSDWNFVKRTLNALHELSPITCIIHGAAPGADSLAESWATERMIGCDTFRADWDKHGRKAGPLRNLEMLTRGKPDLVVAFPGGAGTAHCVRTAKTLKIDVIELK